MEIRELPDDKLILLFDGVCNLCDSLVQYVIRHDKKDVFRFDSLQSENGVAILNHLGLNPDDLSSMVVYNPKTDRFYDKSDAALEIGKHVGFRIPAAILKAVPRFLRNPVYNFVAKNRYKWYGKKDNCMLPTPEIRSKFL